MASYVVLGRVVGSSWLRLLLLYPESCGFRILRCERGCTAGKGSSEEMGETCQGDGQPRPGWRINLVTFPYWH